MSRIIARLVCVGLGFLFLMAPAISGTLDAPKGVPILTISGAITNKNAGEAAVFDRGMLEALGFESISTKTPWFDGVARF
ncbi:MAG TPA: oxidoreductase, partial [Tianweitania sediminis]|nr:oxidoreductase [Tianweitania sediminis]